MLGKCSAHYFTVLVEEILQHKGRAGNGLKAADLEGGVSHTVTEEPALYCKSCLTHQFVDVLFLQMTNEVPFDLRTGRQNLKRRRGPFDTDFVEALSAQTPFTPVLSWAW